jgi:hypothetical protein
MTSLTVLVLRALGYFSDFMNEFFYWLIFPIVRILSCSVLICGTLNYNVYLFILEHSLFVVLVTLGMCGISHKSIKLDMTYIVWLYFSILAM